MIIMTSLHMILFHTAMEPQIEPLITLRSVHFEVDGISLHL